MLLYRALVIPVSVRLRALLTGLRWWFRQCVAGGAVRVVAWLVARLLTYTTWDVTLGVTPNSWH